MLLTKRQAMEKLGVGEIRLMRLVNTGDLIDQGITRAGGVRHNYKFAQRDVESLKRKLQWHGNGHGNGNGNGHGAPVVASDAVAVIKTPLTPAAPVPPPQIASLANRLTTIEQRLHVIEAGLDALRQSFDDLVRLWS